MWSTTENKFIRILFIISDRDDGSDWFSVPHSLCDYGAICGCVQTPTCQVTLYLRQVCSSTSVPTAGMLQYLCTYDRYTPVPLYLRQVKSRTTSVPTAGKHQSLCTYGRYTQEPLCTYGRYASVHLYLYMRQVYSSHYVPTAGIFCCHSISMAVILQ